MVELINFLDTLYEKQLATLTWRNAEQVAKYFQIKYIEEKIHKNWLAKLAMPNPKAIAFFIRINGQDIGVTYFHSIDHEKKQTDWGIYIYDETMRRKGVGKEALSECLRYAENVLKLNMVFLEILESNVAAKSLYEKFGFKLIWQKGNIIRMGKTLKPSYQ
ncbi:MAG: GNAT family N-acetyltransferase [Prevotellaceae bacterium]|jgi:UDP-4-amino-4,6-dideoxy-N-acetyl-beta-L-altrosamine N-acetyltransferase|nr:GNAT family N-acetyltransferase [Prevotellaceae bacterium]